VGKPMGMMVRFGHFIWQIQIRETTWLQLILMAQQ